MLRITVSDDGRGIDAATARWAATGSTTMRERAEELRGRLRVTAGSGTTVSAELPSPPAAGCAASRERRAAMSSGS